MTPERALAELGRDDAKALEMQAYHKVSRQYLGVANPIIDAQIFTWRRLRKNQIIPLIPSSLTQI